MAGYATYGTDQEAHQLTEVMRPGQSNGGLSIAVLLCTLRSDRRLNYRSH